MYLPPSIHQPFIHLISPGRSLKNPIFVSLLYVSPLFKDLRFISNPIHSSTACHPSHVRLSHSTPCLSSVADGASHCCSQPSPTWLILSTIGTQLLPVHPICPSLK